MITEATVLLIGTIISLITQLDQGVASVLANDRNNKLTQATANLVSKIATDEATVNKLLAAAQNKDSELFQGILNSSPFGSRFRQLKADYSKNKTSIDRYQNETARIQKEGQRAQQDMNAKTAQAQSSGSAIWDLISGRAMADTSQADYTQTNSDFKGD